MPRACGRAFLLLLFFVFSAFAYQVSFPYAVGGGGGNTCWISGSYSNKKITYIVDQRSRGSADTVTLSLADFSGDILFVKTICNASVNCVGYYSGNLYTDGGPSMNCPDGSGYCNVGCSGTGGTGFVLSWVGTCNSLSCTVTLDMFPNSVEDNDIIDYLADSLQNFSVKNRKYCSSTYSGFLEKSEAARAECVDGGGVYSGQNTPLVEKGGYCVSASCSLCSAAILNQQNVLDDDCCNTREKEPFYLSSQYCGDIASSGIGVGYNSDYYGEIGCQEDIPAGGGLNRCGIDHSSSSASAESSASEGESSDSAGGSSASEGGSSGSGDDGELYCGDVGGGVMECCTGTDCSYYSSVSGGDGSSDSQGGGGDGGGYSSSAFVGSSGSGDYSSASGGDSSNSNNYSSGSGGGTSSQSVGGTSSGSSTGGGSSSNSTSGGGTGGGGIGGTGGTGGTSGGGGDGTPSSPSSSSVSVPSDSAGADSANAVSCKTLKNCDWSTLETQLKQYGVEKEILDSLKNLWWWLQYKSTEDSLIDAARWSKENTDREKMMQISETLNGRIFQYYSNASTVADSQLRRLGHMDTINGLYYAASLSAASSNRLALDSLRTGLSTIIGDGTDDIIEALGLINGTLSHVGGGGVLTDLSGVEGGLGTANNLLRNIDSSLSAGNGNIIRYLDSLSRPCEGSECGNYVGLDSGAFGGLDTSGLSASRWDSLLTAPGLGGLQDSASAFVERFRVSTATPFVDGIACPEKDLSVDFCGYFGGSCVFSFCDSKFNIQGKHILEWIGVMLEFVAWIILLVGI